MGSGPPPGINLNDDIKSTVIGPVITLLAIATVAVTLRVISKATSKVQMQSDGYLILVALVRDAALRANACFK
jgi:hypothetical protein